MGGNLSVPSALIGTPYAAEIENHLLFLEDIGVPQTSCSVCSRESARQMVVPR